MQKNIEETVKTPNSENPAEALRASRRRFLTRAAGGGALALALTVAPPLMRKARAQEPCDDLAVLNYALTLEHLEATFYTQGLMRFGAKDLEKLPSLRGSGNALRGTVYDYFVLIRDHEVEHVRTLIAVIEQLGGTPVAPATYNFAQTAFTSVEQFVKVAQALENTGVSAYDGAIDEICAPGLRTAAATIATVEARHAAYLNLLNNDVPFPSAFDTPLEKSEVLTIAGQFIVS